MEHVITALFYRSETSKRGTTTQRAKIKHKVREGRKKSKKAARSDLTWKSSAFSSLRSLFSILTANFTLEKEKDPGIPNDFPYKDQILAEIAEERRQVRLYCRSERLEVT